MKQTLFEDLFVTYFGIIIIIFALDHATNIVLYHDCISDHVIYYEKKYLSL